MPEVLLSNKQRDYLYRPFIDGSTELLRGTPRSGKTTCLLFRLWEFLNLSPDTNHLVLGFNEEQAYKLIIEGEGFGLKYLFPGSQTHSNALGSHLEINTSKGVKRVFYKGGSKKNDQGRFRGASFGSVTFCEWDLLDIETVREAYRRTMASKLRVHFADQNPCSPHHPLYTEIFPQTNIIETRWYLEDNPILTQERIQEIKDKLKGVPLLYKRDVLGLDVLPQGLVYSVFDKDKNTISEQEFKDRLNKEYVYDVFFAVDGGVEHPSAMFAGVITKDNGGFIITSKSKPGKLHFYIVDLLYLDNHKPFSDQAKLMKEFVNKVCNKYLIDSRYSGIYYDPACKALGVELDKLNLLTYKADNNSHNGGVKFGIERIQSMLVNQDFYIIDSPSMEPLYKEISTYSYDSKGEIVKVNDDTCDALRYLVNNYCNNYLG